jgi:hypothetical protein
MNGSYAPNKANLVLDESDDIPEVGSSDGAGRVFVDWMVEDFLNVLGKLDLIDGWYEDAYHVYVEMWNYDDMKMDKDRVGVFAREIR